MTRNIDIIYTMWLRDMLRFYRSKAHLIGALSAPLTFLFFLGPGFISGFQFREGNANLDIGFFAPGLIGMSILFASLFGSISIIYDREFGILKNILITPVNRSTIVLGKAFGVITIAMIQGILILIITALVGVKFVSIAGVLAGIIVMFLSGMGFIGLGIILASKVDSLEGFQMVMSFLAMPIVMLSGGFFPISNLPVWLKTLVYINPLTYGIDALRLFISGRSTIPVSLSIIVMILFAMAAFWVAGKMFGKMRV